MTYIEKLKLLESHPDRIYFFSEGCFYKLYNENLFWFCNEIKPKKVIFKHFIKENLNLVYGGFPMASISNLKNEYSSFFSICIEDAFGFFIKANIIVMNTNLGLIRLKNKQAMLLSFVRNR